MSERRDTSPVGEEYHGWVNYPTWAVHQWLSAEPANAAAARRILEAAGDDVHQGSEDLRAWIEDGTPLMVDEPSLYSDILGWGLRAIAWVDIARAFAPEKQGGEQP